MFRAEQQELHPAPEEGPRQELRSFPFYSKAEERLFRGQETLKRAGEDSELLGAAFLKFYGAVKATNQEFLTLFKPIYELDTSSIDPRYSAFRENLSDLHRLNLIEETDYEILSSEKNKEARNEFAHGDEFPLPRQEVEVFSRAAERACQELKKKTCELWEELVTQTDRSQYGSFTRGLVRNRAENILIKDIIGQGDKWIDPFFDSEEDWRLQNPSRFPIPNKFLPRLPLTESDFVVTTQEEASVKNPAKINLFARLLTGEDLNNIKPETFKGFLDHDFPVVVFIPERHREGFLEKLDSIKEEVSFVDYHYDKNAQLHLILEHKT